MAAAAASGGSGPPRKGIISRPFQLVGSIALKSDCSGSDLVEGEDGGAAISWLGLWEKEKTH